MGLRAAPVIVLGALSATPGQAGDMRATRVRAIAEVVYRPGAMKPAGVALAADVSHFSGRYWHTAPSPSFGGGARVEVFLDKEVRLALEPTVGLGIGDLESDCTIGWEGGGGHFELRPGLVYSLRTGTHAWLGGSAEGTWLPFIARARGGVTVSFRRHRSPNKFEAPFRETIANVSAGLGGAYTLDCDPWVHGRPLRSDVDVVLAGFDASGPVGPGASTWLEQAREEHAAAAAFLRLAAELAALGAPSTLVERTLAAATEEVAHARLCLDRASALGGIDVTLHPIRTTARIRVARETLLAVLQEESLIDGALNEGLAAADAARQAADSTDPVGAAVHARIAREELGHAILAVHIARWCQRELQVGGQGARIPEVILA